MLYTITQKRYFTKVVINEEIVPLLYVSHMRRSDFSLG